MGNRPLFKLIGLLAMTAMLLSSCQGAATEAPPAEEPTTAAPAVEPATQAPTEEQPAAAAPTEVRVCATLATGLDNGWDRTFYEAYQRVQADSPHGLVMADLKFTEGLMGDEAEAAMRAFAQSGECDIIWTHGGFNDEVKNLRDKFPDLMWIEVGSGVTEYGGNDYHFWHRCYEPGYLMGLLAGHMTKRGVIGAVGNYPSPEVNDIINAFFAGAKSVNPDIQQKVAFINSWWDPPKAMEAGNAQITAGADHILEIAESFEPCVEAGIFCYGPYIDYSEYYPETALASFIGIWDPTVRWVLEEWYKAKVSGQPFDAPEAPTFSMVSGACDVALNQTLLEKIPPGAIEAFNQAKQQIMEGSLVVPFDENTPESD